MSENTWRRSSNCMSGWEADRNTRLKREREKCLGTKHGARAVVESNTCTAARDIKRSRCASYTSTRTSATAVEQSPQLCDNQKIEAPSVHRQEHVRKSGPCRKYYYGEDCSETASDALRRTLRQRRLDDKSITLRVIQIVAAARRPMTFSELDTASKTIIRPPYHHRNDAQASDEVQTRSADDDINLMELCRDLINVNSSGIVEFFHEDMGNLVSSVEFREQFGLRNEDEILAAICIQHLGCDEETSDDMRSLRPISCPSAGHVPCTLRTYAVSFWKKHYFAIKGGSQLIHSLLHGSIVSSLSSAGTLETRCQRGCNDVLSTGLEVAATHDLLVLGRVYFEMGAEVRHCNHLTHTPLHTAAANASVEMIRYLLECGADPNGFAGDVLESPRSTCSAVEAALSTSLALRSLGHNQCHCWHCCGCFSGRTPLHLAAATGQEEPVKLVVAGGADINLSTKRHGDTALHLATRSGRFGIVQILIASGADIGRQNSVGATALQFAKTGHHYLIAKLLVAAAPPMISEPVMDAIYVEARHDRDQSTSPVWRMHSLSLEDRPLKMSLLNSKTVPDMTRLATFGSTDSEMSLSAQEPLAQEESWILVEKPDNVLQESP
jgi:ankyrin repeat protein